jgi:hypothetical protein
VGFCYFGGSGKRRTLLKEHAMGDKGGKKDKDKSKKQIAKKNDQKKKKSRDKQPKKVP